VTTGCRRRSGTKNTQGVVIRINSPGGSPVQAQTSTTRCAGCALKYPDIPCTRWSRTSAPPGGYFIAVGADRIYAASRAGGSIAS